jgi:hypothetical protein
MRVRMAVQTGIVFAACCLYRLAAQTPEPRQQLIAYLDGIAHARLEERKQAVARIQTRAAAEARKNAVRQKILGLIGGLPASRGAVSVKQLGSVSGDGFRVEKIAYESLPGFWVTADVYLPAAGAGPFPAIVVAPGHGAAGKLENWSWGGNFARNGIVALAYDPLGQGERLQYFDAEKKASSVGGPTGEHGEANVAPMLIGDDVARYMVNDAMRGVDYLISRKDVDGARIGAFGCSGGGTATAYFAALDDRVKAAATACYITSFEALLPSPTGVQDAEQTLPHFVEQGLDFGDWVELMAPKPYAIVSTTNDMFPFEGARQTYEEAKRIYGLYGADDKLQWLTGPGGHGNLGPISPAILSFFTTRLNGGPPAKEFTPLRLQNRDDLQCTATGQVATSLGGETVYSVNKKRAESVIAPQKELFNKADLERLQVRLRQDIRTLAGVTVQPGGAPPVVDVTKTEQREGYRVETISMHSDADMTLFGVVAIPDTPGAKSAVLLVPPSRSGITDNLDGIAKSGRLVLVLESRLTPPGTESVKSPYLGIYNLLSLRAFLVGRTMIGLRIDDMIRAVDWLCARKDVQGPTVVVSAVGPMAMAALHAAVLDPRIVNATLWGLLTSYRTIVDQPLHRNVSEVVIPGVLRSYDVGDLLLALSPRKVTLLNPTDALGDAVSVEQFRKSLAYIFRSETNLNSVDRIAVATIPPN